MTKARESSALRESTGLYRPETPKKRGVTVTRVLCILPTALLMATGALAQVWTESGDAPSLDTAQEEHHQRSCDQEHEKGERGTEEELDRFKAGGADREQQTHRQAEQDRK